MKNKPKEDGLDDFDNENDDNDEGFLDEFFEDAE